MMIIFVLIFGFVTMVVGRWLFGQWYNHVTLYGGVWSFTLILFEMKFINYYPLESETWILIISGWLSFLFGSVTIYFARYARGKKSVVSYPDRGRFNVNNDRTGRLIRSFIWIFTLASLASTIQYWSVLLDKFGSVGNVLIWGNLLYSLRTSGTLEGGIPYLGALALAGSLLGGVYVGLTGKMRMIALFPFVVIILSSIATMGRATLIIATLLFITGMVLTNNASERDPVRSILKKVKRLSIIVFVLLIVIGSIEFIRSHRGVIESLPGATQSLNKLKGGSFITPSIYLYLTVHYGVLNQYLKHDEEQVAIGTHTFAPFWRFLSKLGFDTYVPEYQVSYLVPVGSNTGTFLREIHADFGLAGVFLFPYILGLITSQLWYKLRVKLKFTTLSIISHLYVIVGMSYIVGTTRLGYWMVSLFASIFAGYIIDRSWKWPSYKCCVENGEIKEL